MGGSPNLLMPVNPSYSASWLSHTHRSPRSSEPGTDMFVPIGTPVYAPADGWIYGYGTSIAPPTGRWVGINFDNGLRFRGMHFSRLVRTGGWVRRGDLIAYSGASGYGHEDWSHLPGMPGAHVHVTLWESHNMPQWFGYRADGRPWTVDFMQYVGGEQAAGVVEEDMVNVSEEQLRVLLDGALAASHTRKITGGSIENDDQVIPLLRRAVKAAEATFPNATGARSILGGSIADRDGDGKQDEPGVIARLRTILAVVQQLAKNAGIDFDYETFAAELAPYLELRTLSDGDLKAIATAAADEQDRRDRERLDINKS